MSTNVIGRPVLDLFAHACMTLDYCVAMYDTEMHGQPPGLAIKLVADYIRTGDSSQRSHISGFRSPSDDLKTVQGIPGAVRDMIESTPSHSHILTASEIFHLTCSSMHRQVSFFTRLSVFVLIERLKRPETVYRFTAFRLTGDVRCRAVIMAGLNGTCLRLSVTTLILSACICFPSITLLK